MKKFLFLFGLIMVVFVGAALASVAGELGQPAFDPVEYARQQAEIARLERDLEQEAFWSPIRASAMNLFLLALLTTGARVIWVVGGAHAARFRDERMPRGDGLLPVRATDLEFVAPQALGAFHAARQLEAGRQPVPHTISYHAPHYRGDLRGDVAAPAALATTEPAALPGLTDLADLQFRPSREAILLGLSEGGQFVTAPASQLMHIGVAGPTGNGKSNIARLLCAQLLAMGSRLVILDPKFTEYDAEQQEDWRPIARRLHREPAYTPRDIAALLRWTEGELDQRLGLRRAGQPVGESLFVYIDELAEITDTVKGAQDSITRLARLARGVRIYLLTAAQDWLVDSIGISGARDNFRTGYYLGGDKKTGSILLDMAQRDLDESGLTTGVAMLRSAATTPARMVRVPYASNRAVRALLGDGAEDMVTLGGAQRGARGGLWTPAGTTLRTTPAPVAAPGGVEHQDGLNPRQRDLLRAMAQGKGNSEILRQVYGVDTGQRGPEYKAGVEALRTDQAMIARLMGVEEE